MIKTTTCLLLSTTLWLSPAHAINDAQFDTIKQLGKLNGSALNCRYLNETQQMKRAMIETLPKLRILGEAFNQATNEGFLAMIAENKPCPDEQTLSRQVDQRIEAVKRAFMKPEKLFQ
ncbi:MAG: hypothetical protein HN842_09055 [Gammaproteobacteria bacterium]|jgi:hypothetical protein|nr:hypothetical protein [Gammaproteobacteria bacterium]MBT7308355.1 hypothetical protein [Gammaproteobacteria bacterium]